MLGLVGQRGPVTGVEMGPNGLKAIGSADIVKVGLNGSANRIVTDILKFSAQINSFL